MNFNHFSRAHKYTVGQRERERERERKKREKAARLLPHGLGRRRQDEEDAMKKGCLCYKSNSQVLLVHGQ